MRRLLIGILSAACAAPLSAQEGGDTVVVVAGAEYGAGSGLKRELLGRHYRDLWSMPVRVPVLDLSAVGGGLTPTEPGGGNQTVSLHLLGADGREYRFRSVNKWPALAREPAFGGTLAGHVIQDQTKSIHPGAALAVPPLAQALGILHVTPRLYVMPDAPELGEFRERFAGMLGQLEENPDEREGDEPGWGGFTKITDTDKLLERLEESSEDRVSAHEYLTARLLDLLINDWDRHVGNWRWARSDSAGVRYWRPIALDRDYAFVDYDGALMDVARVVVKNAVRFTPRIDNVYGLTLNARALDRQLLAGLERAAFDSVAASVRLRLTDALIDSAVMRLPPEYRAAPGAQIAATLKSRRDSLGKAARKYYELLSSDVDIHATDERDVALVEREPGGAVVVRLHDAGRDGEPEGGPYLARRFLPDETDEVRLFMHGGGDRVVVRGRAPRSITVRVVGGGGDDVLVDSSSAGGGAKTAFYDDRGDNRIVRGPATAVSTRPFDAPDAANNISGESYRDWGFTTSVTPEAGFHGPDGPIVGATYTLMRHGFRKLPYASLHGVTGRVGLFSGAVALETFGDFHRQNSRAGLSYRVGASQLESIHFYGYGNGTRATRLTDYYLVRQDELLVETVLHADLPAGVLSAGPALRVTRTQVPRGTPFALENGDRRTFSQLGATAAYHLDRRDQPSFPTRGALLDVDASAYPGALSAGSGFGALGARATGYWSPPVAGRPTFAARAGARRVWGDFPVHEAAFLGGSRTLRGFSSRRFAGSGVVYGGVDARVPVDTVNLGLLRGQLGVLGLADVGRVFHPSDTSDALHHALGGGLWFAFRVRSTVLGASVSYARGEKNRVYLDFGAPF